MRYGWTFGEIQSLTAQRFFSFLKVIEERQEEEEKQRFIIASFNAWQINELLKSVHSEKPKLLTFNEYLTALGLKEAQKKDTKEQAKINIVIANSIRELDRQQQSERRKSNERNGI